MTKCIFPSHLRNSIAAFVLFISLIPEGHPYITYRASLLAPNVLDSESDSLEDDDQRIVGGRPAHPGEAPYQISLLLYEQHHCGATLVISPRSALQYAITAAHCVTDPQTKQMTNYPNEYSVRAGSTNRNQGQTFQVADIVFHERWNFEFQYDIALIFFQGSFSLSQSLYPADLPDGNEQVHEITVSGWGNLQENGRDIPLMLQIVKLPTVDTNTCNRIYKQLNGQQSAAGIDNSNICAGVPQGGKDACQGDSGGPAVVGGSRGHKLVGIVSFGQGCAQPGIPGVYTKVSSYKTWINYYVGSYEQYIGQSQSPYGQDPYSGR